MAASGAKVAKGMKNYYKILGIEKEEANDPTKLKKAYHKKARETHSDKVGGSDKQFQLVQEAYSVLSDPEKKIAYEMSQGSNEDFLSNLSRPEYYQEYSAGAQSSNQGEKIDAHEIRNNLHHANAHVDIYIPPNFKSFGNAKGTYGHGRNDNTSFENDFPNGYYPDMSDLSFNERSGELEITIRKFKSIRHTVPTINYKLSSQTFLLAVTPKDDFTQKPIVVGLITVSAGNKFAIFSLIEGLSDDDIIKGLFWKGLDSLPHHFGSAHSASSNGCFGIMKKLIPSREYCRSLTNEERKFAQDEIGRIDGKFASKDKIKAIKKAVDEDSTQALSDAFKIKRISVTFWKEADSSLNMPVSLQHHDGSDVDANPLAIEFKK